MIHNVGILVIYGFRFLAKVGISSIIVQKRRDKIFAVSLTLLQNRIKRIQAFIREIIKCNIAEGHFLLIFRSIRIDYQVIAAEHPGMLAAFFSCRHWIGEHILRFESALVQRLFNNAVGAGHNHRCTSLLECPYSIPPAKCPVLWNGISFPSQLFIEIQRFYTRFGIEGSNDFAALHFLNLSAGLEQEVGPVPAGFIAFTHWSDTGDAFFGISYPFGGVQHILPGPVHGRNGHAFIIQHLLINHCRGYITFLGYTVDFPVNNELVLQHRIDLILVLIFVP
ncbi:hypothetical protein D3C75_766730 [compost metagenome]